jgi:hypothetical protein
MITTKFFPDFSGTSKTNTGQPTVAHVYNPSYSEGRDHEDCGLKPTVGK